MMASEPIDDVVAWSNTQVPWRQDCLRRLAIANDLSESDEAELLGMIKHAAGFTLAETPPTADPFTKGHFSGGSHTPIVLKGIANIAGVNRLVANASLDFCPKALTVVYGRNGSGKSGFVRILRTACRTRIESAATLKVLADVYGDGKGALSADIMIDAGTGDVPIAWSPGMTAAPQLGQVAVFDTASAQLYVDGGNKIRYLPFGLALPHRLNGVCLSFKAILEAEQQTAVGTKISLATVTFLTVRETAAQKFNSTITKATTDAAIEKASSFSEADEARLNEVTCILSAGSTAAADMANLVSWVDSLAVECATAETGLSDEALAAAAALKSTAVIAREAARLAAGALFDDEPLPGVSSESWRKLWRAAREYSVTEAYPEKAFPVLPADSVVADCVLCQQPLLPDGAARMQRFQAYMDDTLDTAATTAEQAVIDTIAALPAFKQLTAVDFAERIEQIRSRDTGLADALTTFQASVTARHAEAEGRLAGGAENDMPVLASSTEAVKALATKLADEKAELIRASDADQRLKFESEKGELEDRKILNANAVKLITRRDLMVTDAAYAKALALVATTGITKRANELLDTHLTSAVVSQFDAERERFEIKHLKIGLARKSGQTKAEFEVNPQTTLTKITSQILSEGEQRALALAGFLTEVALTDGSGPIIVDDPVSSLDRERSAKVADRIAEEAGKRQVVVFTHDMVFFNELCRAADEAGIEPVTVALFSDLEAAGKVDPAGMGWKGLNVAKRISNIKNRFAPMPKLHAASPANYEYEIKGLYGRLRDTYERVVEEVIFCDIVRRGSDVVQTQMLRYVTLPDTLAIRFHEGMSRANTHSHDNPASDTVPVPKPEEFQAHLAELEQLVADFKAAKDLAEAARPQMKPKK
ncbi:AAA family ATPase [Sphingopyxis sp. OPL5]|nr:AAA family ATPase [Sphingopyxis sp. OPL5]